MSNSVFANSRGVAHKGSGGLSIAFPDVCKTPVPLAGGLPIPYPNIATTAAAKQKTGSKTAPAVTKKVAGHQAGLIGGVKSGTLRSVKSGTASAVAQGEALQLRNRMHALNQQLQGLPATQPELWQAVLEDYAVTASALYVTLNGD